MYGLRVGKRSRLATLGLVGAMLFAAVAACGSSGSSTAGGKADSKAGVDSGWLYDGSVKDKGFEQAWYEAQKKFADEFGGQARYVQNLPYTSQLTTTASNMIQGGAKMMFDATAGGSLFYKACTNAPDVGCVEPNGITPLPKNVVGVYPKNWLAEYVEGYAAGLLTKSGVIGFLEAFPNTPAPVMESVNALTLGCQASHPGCRTITSVANSWYNPPVETEKLNSLVDAGADVITSAAADPVSITVAQKRGVWGIGSWSNPVASGPDAFVTSLDVDWYPAVAELAKSYKAGTFPGGTVKLWGFGPGMKLAPWGPKVPAGVKTASEKILDQIKGGKNFFCGPIRDNAGKVRVAKGTCMSDHDIYQNWNWFVDGVSAGK